MNDPWLRTAFGLLWVVGMLIVAPLLRSCVRSPACTCGPGCPPSPSSWRPGTPCSRGVYYSIAAGGCEHRGAPRRWSGHF